MHWEICQRVDLALDKPQRVFPECIFVRGDARAHRWTVELTRAGQEVPLDGYTVTATMLRPDGATVALAGVVSGSTASVELSADCYAVTGHVTAWMALSDGVNVITVAEGRWTVSPGGSDVVVDTEGVIPSLPALLSEIANMRGATADAQAATTQATEAAGSARQAIDDLSRNTAPAIVQQASGNMVVITDGAARPALSLVSQISAVQSGSGDPSPDNVRPITGWDALTLYHTGRNMIKFPYIDGGAGDTISKNGLTITIGEDGSVHVVGTASTTTFVNLCSMPGLAESNITEGSMVGGITATDCRYTYANGLVTIRVSGGTTVDKTYYPMLTTSGAAAFEPYDGVTLTAELPETVYGGRLDWTKGVLTVTHGHIEAYAGEDVPDGWVSSVGALTDGAQVVYPLAEPYTIQLDPQTLDMLRGYNTIWCRTGSTAVGYVADTQMYVESHGGGGDAGYAEYAAYAERAGEADNALMVGGLRVSAVPITDWDTITPAAGTVYLVYDPEVTA